MKAKFTLVVLCFSIICAKLLAQIPLVYNVENSGASCNPPPLPGINQLPVITPLPDPFLWANGSGRSTNFSDWECHRNEVRRQIENYEIGVKPPKPESVTATYTTGATGAPDTLRVLVTRNGQSMTLTSQVYRPTGSGPFPAVIGMNSPSGSVPATVFTSRNIARIQYNHNNVTTYGAPALTDPFYRLYPEYNLVNSGQYAAWAWGVSRIIDGLELVQSTLPIDLSHIGVTGCSYAGKMALFSGAFDERIALTIAQESGGGGAPAWRASQALEPNGSVEKIDNTDYGWFRDSMRLFQGDNVYKLPHDHHELMAMIAPRALLATGNTDFTWLSNQANYVASRATKAIYDTLGIRDRFGFYIDGGHNHCAVPTAQVPAMQAFVDKFLAGLPNVNTDTVTVNPFPNVNYQRWYQWWGTGNPILPPLPPDPPGKRVWLEAECARVGSRWIYGADTAASNGRYITVRPGLNSTTTAPTGDSSLVVFSFNIDSVANYFVRARVNCPTADDDSYWVKIDNGAFATINGLNGAGWQWVLLTNATLSVGAHTITIGYREDGAKLDKLLITTSTAVITGKGDSVINCGVSQIPLVYNTENSGGNCAPPLLPTINQLPVIKPLPDPFLWANGSGRSTNFSDWECHRNEYKAEIENYEIGTKPPKPDNISATFSYTDSTLRVTVVRNGKSMVISSKMSLPATSGPWPAVIGMNSLSGSIPATVFTSRNIARITFSHNNVTTYGNPTVNDPFYQLYPEYDLVNSGQYAAWAWGVSRIIDGLELVKSTLPIDLSHVGVTGCSYAGKMALYSGAFDERIALTIAQESGGGGAPAWRASDDLEIPGSVEKIDNTDYNWFRDSMRTFQGDNVYKLPHDHHELMAMIAPRALLATGNTDFYWLSNQSNYVTSRATKEIYNTLGIGDRFGFYIDGGHNHCAVPNSQVPAIQAFVDKFLAGMPNINTDTVIVNPYPAVNYQRWYQWWGTGNAVLPPAPGRSVWLEAECAAAGSAWRIQGDTAASNAKYISVKPGLSSSTTPPTADSAYLIFPFSTDTTATFYLAPRLWMYGPATEDYSFWMKLDNGTPQVVSSVMPANNGFENGRANWSVINGGASVMSIDSVAANAHSGNSSMKIVNSTNRAVGNQWQVQISSSAFPTTVGKQYQISYWVRATTAGGSIRLSSGPTSAQYQADQTIGTTWQQVSWTITATLSSTTFLFDAGLVANTYYIDDASIREVNGSGGWQWLQLNNIMLTPGLHTLAIGYKDGSAKLDKMVMTTYNTLLSRITTSKGDPTTNCAVLPVTLTKFGGELIGSKVQLKWTTVSELNVQQYEIEKSSDGRTFSKIGSVRASNSAVNNQYTFEDASVGNNVQYYRLRIVDKDGNFKYSTTIAVLVKGSAALSLLPNPAISNLFTLHEKAGTNASISITDMIGKRVMSIKVAAESLQTTINVASLAAGTYILNYTNEGKTQIMKFVKQ